MKLLGCVIVCLGLIPPAFANDSEPPNPPEDWQRNFDAKQSEITTGVGVFFSPFVATKGRPTVNYAGPLVQYGYMLNDLEKHGPLDGNLELLTEVFGAGVFTGHGTYLAGTTFWLRYNVVPPRWRVSPYFQIGAGVTFTDVDHRFFGQTFNFNLNAATGVRYFIDTRCSLNAEYRFEHVSNANLADHNLGINSQGAVLSVSWFF